MGDRHSFRVLTDISACCLRARHGGSMHIRAMHVLVALEDPDDGQSRAGPSAPQNGHDPVQFLDYPVFAGFIYL